jgi:hypothetical protein
MLSTINNPAHLKENFSKTPYHNDEGWQLFESILPELKVILEFLKDIEFDKYWAQNIRPKVETIIKGIEPELPKYDVIKENEEFLGYKLPSDTITVYMLYYAQPHGIKITGTRFLTDVVAVPEYQDCRHEMMHPPYDYQNDEVLRNTIELFRKDDFLMDKVTNHNLSFGYNTLEGLFEEDCVQSLDQVINEKLGMGRDAKKRWVESDDGIHVLAIALYQIMKVEYYNSGKEVFRDFLLRLVKTGTLAPGKIKEYYDKFYN